MSKNRFIIHSDLNCYFALVEMLRNPRIKNELGLYVSIGLSFNKIFSKLGSDLRKPDNYTVITPDNYKEIVWPLPAGDLLYVGKKTQIKLASQYIKTIGDIANCDPDRLHRMLGKQGYIIYAFANGEDRSEVKAMDYEEKNKSIGNSFTCPRDLENNKDAFIMITVLAESVGAKLRESGVYANTVEVNYISSDMEEYAVRQVKLPVPTNLSGEIANTAYDLFVRRYDWKQPLRKIGVRCSGLTDMSIPRQLTLWEDAEKAAKRERLEYAIYDLRKRFNNKIIQRGMMLEDTVLSSVDPKRDNNVQFYGTMSL